MTLIIKPKVPSFDQWRLEIEKARSSAAICIPSNPISRVCLKDITTLLMWWHHYRYNIAIRLQQYNYPLFLVTSIVTTSQYANCCVGSGVENRTALDISGYQPSTTPPSFPAGGQIKEVDNRMEFEVGAHRKSSGLKSWGFRYGLYEADLRPWVIFISHAKVAQSFLSILFSIFYREPLYTVRIASS